MKETTVLNGRGLQLAGTNPKSTAVILHGNGQKGTDLTLISRMTFYKALAALDLPHIFIFPQLASDQGGFYPNTVDPAFDLADKIATSLGLPKAHHYAGLSQGGIDVSSNLAHFGARVKSAMTCPGKVVTDDKPTMDAYRAVPHSWHYYDPADNTISYGNSSVKTMFQTLKAEGKTNVDLTELPGMGHDVWDIAFLGGTSPKGTVVPSWYSLIEQIDAGTVIPPAPVVPHLFVDDVDLGQWPSGTFKSVVVK
jgi:hypothetical protein